LNGSGTGHFAVYKYLEERGIPDLFSAGIPAFSEPTGSSLRRHPLL
jgi:hypothetical protein